MYEMLTSARCSVPFCSYLIHRQERSTWIAFIDSSKPQVCYNLRILRHQVFQGTVKREKGTMGSSTEIKVISLIHWIGNLQTRE
ncbi:Mobile element protein [Candidatus Enterovibrio escicola]|uniref:Mobile element protein n=2 Tax=Candidatus Enterovibrio escicola TaxID=1927127 RepID=A0A2A5T3N0_9GAMM|nr:Mobile element protein [Candidatus Enterovibrio escacola]